MKNFKMVALGLMLVWSVGGCGDDPTTDAGTGKDKQNKKAIDGKDAHDHPHGPHDGEIIDFGSIHGELVDDHKAGKVTVYILGGDMKTPASADEDHVTFRLKLNDEPTERKLIAVDEGRSQFELTDKALVEALHHPKAHNARLYVKYKGEVLSKDIEQGHDHHGHDHGHDHGD